jgi:hypothetical protein
MRQLLRELQDFPDGGLDLTQIRLTDLTRFGNKTFLVHCPNLIDDRNRILASAWNRNHDGRSDFRRYA